MGLSDLEKGTEAGGVLHVCVGDALSPSVTVPGGYAGKLFPSYWFFLVYLDDICLFLANAAILGIIVDLFSDGKVLPQLQEVNRNNLILMVQVLF